MFRKRSDTKAKQNRGRHRCALFHVIWDVFRHFAREHFFRFLFIASLLWRSKRLGHMTRDETRIMTSHNTTWKRMSAYVCLIVRRVNLQTNCSTLASISSGERAAQHMAAALRSTAALHKRTRNSDAGRKGTTQDQILQGRSHAHTLPAGP